MTTLAPDTSPEIEQSQIDRLRQTPHWRKMALMAERFYGLWPEGD